MKRYIKGSDLLDEEFVPEITKEYGNEIIDTVVEEVTDCIRARYRNASVESKDAVIKPNEIHAVIIIWNKNTELRRMSFDFNAYDEYFDEKDYFSHINRTIRKFVSAICQR